MNTSLAYIFPGIRHLNKQRIVILKQNILETAVKNNNIITPEEIYVLCCKMNMEYNHSRRRKDVQVRQIAMFWTMQLIKRITFKAVGQVIGNKNHATVIHGIKTIQGMIDIGAYDIIQDVIEAGELIQEYYEKHQENTDVVCKTVAVCG